MLNTSNVVLSSSLADAESNDWSGDDWGGEGGREEGCWSSHQQGGGGRIWLGEKCSGSVAKNVEVEV